MTLPLEEKLALRELDDNVPWMRVIFQHYLSWYTLFITANLFVLSWVFTKDVRTGTLPLAILFIFLNACGTVTAILLARYISAATQRNRILVDRLNALAGEELGLAGVSKGNCRMFLANWAFRKEYGNRTGGSSHNRRRSDEHGRVR